MVFSWKQLNQQESWPMSNHVFSADGVSITLLDVGGTMYGDCILCQFGEVSVLVDGAHPQDVSGSEAHASIPDQIAKILGQQKPPYTVSLLIVTHPHEDHVGCLPELV